MESKGRLIHAAAFRRVSTGLTVSRKTATNISAVRWKLLTVSRNKSQTAVNV